MDKSYVIPVLTELREMRAKTYKLTDYHAFTKLKEDDCKFILSRAIELIEYLDGKLEDFDYFQDLAISRNNEFQQELERSTQLEQRIKVLTAERDLTKKLVTRKSEELKRQLNDPANFCGNCRHYAQMSKDDGDFEGICTKHYIKRVDPDDASCKHFQSNQVDRVTVGKPEFPCCDHCSREDCDNCTLCPF